MMCKFAAFFALCSFVNAGYIAGPAYTHASYSFGAPYSVATRAVVSQQSNILRSHDNLGQVSSYGKTISTPHSTVYKSDIRVSSGAPTYPYVQGYAAAPAYSHAYVTPAYSHSYAAPSYKASAYSHGYISPTSAHGYTAYAPAGLLGVSYSPATSAAHFSYSNGYGLQYFY